MSKPLDLSFPFPLSPSRFNCLFPSHHPPIRRSRRWINICLSLKQGSTIPFANDEHNQLTRDWRKDWSHVTASWKSLWRNCSLKKHEASLNKHVLKSLISLVWNKMWGMAQLIHLVNCKKKFTSIHIKYGTQGRVGRGRGTSNTGTQGTRDVNDYCDTVLRFQSLSSWICFGEGSPPYPFYGSSMPVYEAKTRRRPPSLKKVKPLSWSSCWWNIGALSRVRWVAVAIRFQI